MKQRLHDVEDMLTWAFFKCNHLLLSQQHYGIPHKVWTDQSFH